MNRPREGNVPSLPPEKPDPPEGAGRYSLVRKLESGLAEPGRDTLRNRVLADRNGWTEAEYYHWVDSGDPPIRSVVRETHASRPDEIDDDERLHEH
jgi:hypothetical protein